MIEVTQGEINYMCIVTMLGICWLYMFWWVLKEFFPRRRYR